MVLAATLASVQFFTALQIPQPLRESFLMAVQPNGLCFWSCMFLASSASKRTKWLWRMRPRSEQGYPTSSDSADEETKLVTTWALSINGGKLPEATKKRILKEESAIQQDIEPWFLKTNAWDW